MAVYTEKPGNRRYKQILWGSQPIPPCSHPHIDHEPCDEPGEFDTPTKYGPWADLCGTHLLKHTFTDQSIGFHRVKELPV